MTPPRAITIRLAEPRDAQAIGILSRDGLLGKRYCRRLLPLRRTPEGRRPAHTSSAAPVPPSALQLGPGALRRHLVNYRNGEAPLRLAPQVVVENVLAVAVEVRHV